MSGGGYWDRRRAALEALTDQRCRLTAGEIARLYDRALDSILRRVDRLFQRFVQGYHLPPEQAMALLTTTQTREARAALQELFDSCEDAALREELRARLDAPAYAYRISRLEALRDQVYFDAKAIGVKEVQYQEARLKDLYEQSYYRTVFDLSQEQGKNVPFQLLDNQRTAEAVREYWSPSPEEPARSFSDRVRENTTELAEQVRETVTVGLVNGGNYREMAQELAARMGDVRAEKKLQPDGSVRTALTGSGAKYRAARLIRTEGNHISGQATIRTFRDAGIQRYLYRALLELRTCKTCGELDGRDFPVDGQRPGVNMHPMHPNCRCFIAPYHGKDWLARYTRSAQTGEKSWAEVPQSMTYAEWYAKYVEGQIGTLETPKKPGGVSKSIDITAERRKYNKWAESVPEPYRERLQYYNRTTDYVENTKLSGPFGYSVQDDVVYYNPASPEFGDFDFGIVNTHELAHRLDALSETPSWKDKAFSAALTAGREYAKNNAKTIEAYLNKKQPSVFFADILSAMGVPSELTLVGHDVGYWNRAGTANAEVFANLFALNAYQSNDLELVREWFPDLLAEFEKRMEDF